jgi:hypothetical protein
LNRISAAAYLHLPLLQTIVRSQSVDEEVTVYNVRLSLDRALQSFERG